MEVTRRKVIEEGIEETVRLDTHEVVGVRALSPGERQCEMDLEAAASRARLPLHVAQRQPQTEP